jgi:hypothetical protein
MLMKEMNVSEPKDLRPTLIIPTAKCIQIHSFSKTFRNISKQSAHKSEVISIYRDKVGHMILVLIVKISYILSIDKGHRLLFNSVINDTS